MESHHIHPSEIGPRSVKSNESWHFERQALLIVGRRYLAFLDRDLAQGVRSAVAARKCSPA
jgi:hypothetical protein